MGSEREGQSGSILEGCAREDAGDPSGPPMCWVPLRPLSRFPIQQTRLREGLVQTTQPGDGRRALGGVWACVASPSKPR